MNHNTPRGDDRNGPPQVILQEPLVERLAGTSRAFSLSKVELAAFADQIGSCDSNQKIRSAIEWLKVNESDRYRPEPSSTFCNIYAHDICLLLGIFLPRVWWTDSVIKNGEYRRAVLGRSVNEMSSNALFDWMGAYGPHFGWQHIADLEEAKLAAGRGDLVLAMGRGRDSTEHGHIAALISVSRTAGAGLLQSQAGRRNIRLDFSDAWWDTFNRHAFWAAHPCPQIHGARPAQRTTTAGLIVDRLVPGVFARLEVQIHDILAARPKMSRQIVRALIAGEDRRFLKHRGFDLKGIARAAWTFATRRQLQGASTVEQQLVRTLTNRREQTIWRKVTEIALAEATCRSFPKWDLAEAYLAVAYFGWRMNGVTEAGRRLQIDVADCSELEACQLVAALRYPLPHSPSPNQLALLYRQQQGTSSPPRLCA